MLNKKTIIGLSSFVLFITIITYLDPFPAIIIPNAKTTCGKIQRVEHLAHNTVNRILYEVKGKEYNKLSYSFVDCNEAGNQVFVCYDSLNPDVFHVFRRPKDCIANQVKDTCTCK